MRFKVQSELMKNQRHASILSPGKDFDVVQASDGHAVLFGLHDQGGGVSKLFAFREASGDKTSASVTHGWQEVELTPPGSWSVKAFAVAQNPHTLNYDIVVATIEGGQGGAEVVRISQNNKADAFETLKANGLQWSSPITPPEPVVIKSVLVLNMQQNHETVQLIYADTLKNDQSNLLRRWWIDIAGLNNGGDPSNRWHERNLGADYVAGETTSFVGRPNDPKVVPRFQKSGTYTFGILAGSVQLIYQPSMSDGDASISPDVTRISLPDDASAIAVSPIASNSPYTNLWVMTPKSLLFYKSDNQHNDPPPTTVGPAPTKFTADLFKGVRKMVARLRNGKTVLWCLNEKGQLFYMSCPLGEEENLKKWTAPVPIQKQVSGFAFYVAENAVPQSLISPNVVFAETVDSKMMVLTQNPSTSIWSTNHVLLDDPNIKAMYEQPSFTTRAVVTDDHDIPKSNETVTVTAKIHAICYINNVYYNLSAGAGVNVQTGADGSLTVVQNTTALDAASMTFTAPDGAAVTVDPLHNAYKKLDKVKDVTQVKKKYTDERGNPQDLTTASDEEVNGAIGNFSTLTGIRTSLKDKDSTTGARPGDSAPAPHLMLFDEAVGDFVVHPHVENWFDDAISFVGDVVQSVANAVEHAVNVVEHAIEDVVKLAVQEITQLAEAAWKFVVTIADSTVHFVVDTVEAVAGAVMFVFNKIKMGIQELIAFLGFLFEWQDFKRTHRVLRHFMSEYLNYARDGIETLEDLAIECINKAEAEVDKIKNDTNETASYAETSQKQPVPNGTDSPQSHWASHHASNHLDDIQSKAKDPVDSPLSTALDAFKDLVGDEKDTILKSLHEVVEDVKNDISTMSPLKLVRQVFAVCADFILETGKNMVKFLLGMVKAIFQGVIDALNTKMHIPIISTLYEDFVGEPLTFLDLAALIGAIPVTIIYKLAKNEAPFPDDNGDQYKRMTSVSAKSFPKSLFGPQVSALSMQVETFSIESVAQKKPPPSTMPDEDFRLFQIISSFAAFYGGAIITLVTTIRSAGGVPKWPEFALHVIFGCYICYISPNIVGMFQDSDNWATIFNDVVTGLATLKFAFDWYCGTQTNSPGMTVWNDQISPWVDTLVNVLWLVPAYATEWSLLTDRHSLISDGVALDANFFFDIGGVISPLSSKDLVGPEIAPFGVGFIAVCNTLYSLAMLVSGILKLNHY